MFNCSNRKEKSRLPIVYETFRARPEYSKEISYFNSMKEYLNKYF